MATKILTPYRLFYIDESENMFSLMKDGRVLKNKKTFSFQSVNSDLSTISGVVFDGEKSHIFVSELNFDDTLPKKIASFSGYYYYPSMNEKFKKMAILEVNLLDKVGYATLCIYRKKIKYWTKEKEIQAKMTPPFFFNDDSFLYVDENNLLVLSDGDTKQIICSNVERFCVSSSKQKIAYYDGTSIITINLTSKEKISEFQVNHLTAMTFSENEKDIYYATSFERQNFIYQYDCDTDKISLLTATNQTVTFMGI